MTSSYGYFPPKLYSYLVKICDENKLGMKELQTMLMRKGLQDLGFLCDHEVIGHARTTGEPYCKLCWTRLRTIKPSTTFKGKVVKQGEYWPVETFLDRFYKERQETSTRISKFEHEI